MPTGAWSRTPESARPGKTRTPPSDASAEVAPQDNKEGVLKLSKADGKPGEERAGQLEEELVTVAKKP